MTSIRRRSYIKLNIFALWLGIAVTQSAIFFWTIPGVTGQTAIGKAFGHTADVWTAIAAAGGALTTYGIVRLSPRAEMGGMILLSIALALQAAASIWVFGARAVPNTTLILGLVFACTIRVWIIYQAYRLEQARATE